VNTLHSVSAYFLQHVIGIYVCLTDLCEDEELRERIIEIQREIEHSRLTKSRELSRRRSTNRRRCRIACLLLGPVAVFGPLKNRQHRETSITVGTTVPRIRGVSRNALYNWTILTYLLTYGGKVRPKNTWRRGLEKRSVDNGLQIQRAENRGISTRQLDGLCSTGSDKAKLI